MFQSLTIDKSMQRFHRIPNRNVYRTV